MKEISAFDAKTHLSEYLRAVEHGQSFLIRRRGKTVARLLPPERKPSIDELVEGFRSIRRRIKGKLRVRQLIEEGRRI